MSTSVCGCVPCMCFINMLFASLAQENKNNSCKQNNTWRRLQGKLPITHTLLHSPCHDVHSDIPSQLRAPRAQPHQVDILHTQHQIDAHTPGEQGQRQMCAFVPDRDLLFVAQLQHLKLCVFSPSPGSHRHNEGRQTEKDASAASVFLLQQRPSNTV